MGLFNIFKKHDVSQDDSKVHGWEIYTTWQVVNLKYMWIHQENIQCPWFEDVLLDENTRSFAPVDELRTYILNHISTKEKENGEMYLDNGFVAELEDEDIKIDIQKDKDLNPWENPYIISLAEILKIYSIMVKLSRENDFHLDFVKSELSEEYGFDLSYLFAWSQVTTKRKI